MTAPTPVLAPRFTPLQTAAADDLNALAALIDAAPDSYVGRAAPNAATPPSNAKFKVQAFTAPVTSNAGNFIDVLWPDGAFDQVACCFAMPYGHADKVIKINTISNTGASLILQNNAGSGLASTAVVIQVLVFGWMLG